MNKRKGRKNDFSITYYDNNRRSMFLEYVHRIDVAHRWMRIKNIPWTHSMIYNRRTRVPLQRDMNPDNPIQYNYWALLKNGIIYKEGLSKPDVWDLFSKMKSKHPEHTWRYKYIMQD